MNWIDIKNASYTNSIGDSQLMAVWTDPDFDPPTGASATIQERAWSSPIWYTPAAN